MRIVNNGVVEPSVNGHLDKLFDVINLGETGRDLAEPGSTDYAHDRLLEAQAIVAFEILKQEQKSAITRTAERLRAAGLTDFASAVASNDYSELGLDEEDEN